MPARRRACLERYCSGELHGHLFHRIPRFAQLVGILVEPVNGVEQALTQHLVAEFFHGAHQIERRGFVIFRDGIQGFAQVASGSGHAGSSFICNGEAL
jgi:hypothetical protein